jgi:hypothetical protein
LPFDNHSRSNHGGNSPPPMPNTPMPSFTNETFPSPIFSRLEERQQANEDQNVSLQSIS